MLAVLFATPLWYANATHFREQMARRWPGRPARPGCVVLDAIGMTDVDFTGSRAFGRVLDAGARHGVAFGVARSERPPARDARGAAGSWTASGPNASSPR